MRFFSALLIAALAACETPPAPTLAIVNADNTRDAAIASFEEDDKGMLKAGYLADIAILDRNLFTIPPETIRDASIVMTLVGGQVIYRSSTAE